MRVACIRCGRVLRGAPARCRCGAAVAFLLDDRYRQERVLDAVGDCVSVVCWDEEEHARVLVRALLPTAGAGARESLAREAGVLRGIDGVGFLRFRGAGELPVTDSLYTVLSWPGLRPARDVVMRAPVRDRLAYAQQAARLFKQVHARDVAVARFDPRDLYVSDAGQLMYTDLRGCLPFGSPALNTAGGCPEFAAPEQGDLSGRVTGATDVYALCVWAHVVLCGSPPRRHGRGGWRHPPAVSARVPRSLGEVLLAGLERDPARRIRDAGMLADLLERGWGAATVVDTGAPRFEGLARRLARGVVDAARSVMGRAAS